MLQVMTLALHVLMVSHSIISAIKGGVHNMLSTMGVWGQPQYSISEKKNVFKKRHAIDGWLKQ